MTTPNVDIYRSAAVRWQVSDAGHDPETPSGERLVEWAAKQPNLPSVADLEAKAAEWNLKPEPPRHDPATVDEAIAEARANGDFATASALQRKVEKARDSSTAPQPTDAELAAIKAAREAGDWARASNLQLAMERRIAGVAAASPPEPHEVQPSGGFSPEEQAILNDKETPIKDLIGKAREQGFYGVASTLQTRLEKTTQ